MEPATLPTSAHLGGRPTLPFCGLPGSVGVPHPAIRAGQKERGRGAGGSLAKKGRGAVSSGANGGVLSPVGWVGKPPTRTPAAPGQGGSAPHGRTPRSRGGSLHSAPAEGEPGPGLGGVGRITYTCEDCTVRLPRRIASASGASSLTRAAGSRRV